MDPGREVQHSQTLGITGFIVLIPSALSWILFILFLSELSTLFQTIYKAIPLLVIIFFTINPLVSLVLGIFSNNYESRNVYADIARTGGLVLMGFLLIAVIFR